MTYKPLQHVIDGLAGAPFSPDGYQNFVFQWDRSFYETRVEMAGFKGGDRALDVGCGFGQFAAGLAKFNQQVIAIDRAEWMVETAKVLKERWAIPNMEVCQGGLADLSYSDNSFDYVWCAGVIMFADRVAAMREFHRILKPGGRVYLMMNSWGRWLFKAAKAFSSGQTKVVEVCLKALAKNVMDGSARNYLNLKDADGFCRAHDFKLIAAASDGCIDLSGANRRLPMFGSDVRVRTDDYEDIVLENNIELIAEKH